VLFFNREGKKHERFFVTLGNCRSGRPRKRAGVSRLLQLRPCCRSLPRIRPGGACSTDWKKESDDARTSYDWGLVTINNSSVAAGANVQTVAFIGDRDETIRRIRGDVLVQMRVGGLTAADAVFVAWGLIVAPRGSTVGALPITDGNANWMAYGIAALATQTSTVSSSLGSQVVRFEVDNKSMRKFREDEDLFFIVQTLDIAGAPSVDFLASLRMLAGH